MRKSNLIIFILLFLAHTGMAQFVLVPLPKKDQKKKTPSAAKVQALTPMVLPFWDDFSFSNSKIYPHDTLWEFGQSVDLNFGEGIHPPSLGVVTFDGLDSLGRPYNVDPQVKDYADALVSRALNLKAVPPDQIDSVYLSFYYQFKGNGEEPEPGDRLEVDFKDTLGLWQNVFLAQNDVAGSLRSDTFLVKLLHVDPQFFSDNFQFRFRAYGRLSGPYDTWNVDYVYLNYHRFPADVYLPDRTIAMPITSVFKDYWAIPKKHFISDVDANLTTPTIELYNLQKQDQPISYSFLSEIVTYKGPVKDSVSTYRDKIPQDGTFSSPIPAQGHLILTLDSIPHANQFDPAADSFRIKFKFGLSSKDNVPKPVGDYVAARFAPIDFRLNDTTNVEYKISSYYAYDDGSAEFGAGLNAQGAQFAYYFKMVTDQPDTIVAVDLYFPRFEDEANRIIKLRILSDLSDSQESILYEEDMLVQRSQNDSLIRHKLNTNTVGVKDGFYVGWKEMSAGLILVGFDKNTDSADKIHVNLNGTWDSTALALHGSLMIHPVFGKGGGSVISGVNEPPPDYHVFPNPNAGIFYVPGQPEYVEIIDLAGRPINFGKESEDDRTKIEMRNVSPGIYLLKTLSNRNYKTQKVVVRP